MTKRENAKNKILATFGDNVVNMRKRVDLTQNEVADALGVTRVTVSNIETGRNRTTIDHILRLCALFKCTPNDLMPPVPEVEIKRIVTGRKIVEKKGIQAKYKW